jgi:hypothetical protein
VLEHLAIAESKTSQYLAVRLAKAIAAGLPHEQEESSILAAADGITSVGPLNAPEAVIPAPVVAASAAMAGLRASHEEMRALLQSADGWALAAVQTRHPLFGPLNMYQSLLLIGHHDRRHLPQIRRAAAAREAPARSARSGFGADGCGIESHISGRWDRSHLRRDTPERRISRPPATNAVAWRSKCGARIRAPGGPSPRHMALGPISSYHSSCSCFSVPRWPSNRWPSPIVTHQHRCLHAHLRSHLRLADQAIR